MIGNNGMGPSCVKTSDDLPILIFSHRILRLVAVSPGMLHAYDLFDLQVRETADALQVAPDFFLFEFQLFLIRKSLELTSAAGSCTGAFWFHPVF